MNKYLYRVLLAFLSFGQSYHSLCISIFPCNKEKHQIIAQSNDKILFKWIQCSCKHQDLKNLLSLDLKLQWTFLSENFDFKHLQCSKLVAVCFYFNVKMHLRVKIKICAIWKRKYEDCQLLSCHIFDKQFLVTAIISRTCVYMKISLSYSDICLRTLEF